jgi:ribosomal protein RSM22 (predicted rRNA methylase)
MEKVFLQVSINTGRIERFVTTKSQGKQVYYDARKIHWGDSFPHEPKVRDDGKRMDQRKREKISQAPTQEFEFSGLLDETDDDGLMIEFDEVSKKGMLRTIHD